jgi:pimeloyl-ACP methyl ester carboxylesterase
MQHLPCKPAIALLASCAALLLASAQAQAQIQFKPCGQSNSLACGHLAVPLDPADPTGTTITLAIRRHRASVGEAHSAIIALAGGPGQAAIPFAEAFTELLGPVAATRDLIVFDQRGVGQSHPLSCHAFERPVTSLVASIRSCASQLGPTRAFYTTADTVADIEAIRQAAGYEKLVLYGTSYGTKVAELYAQTYPAHVEALVLDSVVPPDGPDTLNRPTFAALPRVLHQICSHGACRGVSANPVSDLARVLARMRHHPLRLRAIGNDGHAHTATLHPEELLDILLAGDFSSRLRSDFVTTIGSAARGDDAPLARLLLTVGSGEGGGEDFDGPLYFATSCEEQDFPWSRDASPAQRLKQGIDAALALPHSTFAPFSARNAIGFSDLIACANWPLSEPAPTPVSGPFPAVPTLILSGADDLRTPTSGAREVAREIPGSHLLVVPFTGHSVLGDDPSSCSSNALKALFSGATIEPCRKTPTPSLLRPQKRPPLGLSELSPAGGRHGLTGRTAHAVELTISDLKSQLLLELEASGGESLFSPSGLRTGGLRSGWASLNKEGLKLHDYSFVPGLTLSGAIKSEVADLHVGGPKAAHGTLRLGRRHALVGRLDGQSVDLPATSQASAAIVGADATASTNRDTRRPVLDRLTGGLGGPLARLFEP